MSSHEMPSQPEASMGIPAIPEASGSAPVEPVAISQMEILEPSLERGRARNFVLNYPVETTLVAVSAACVVAGTVLGVEGATEDSGDNSKTNAAMGLFVVGAFSAASAGLSWTARGSREENR